MVDSVDSDHLPLTSPIPNLHMWRLHIFSSSKTNVGHFWKLNQLGKPPGGTRREKERMAGLGIPAPWPGSRGSFWRFFFPPAKFRFGSLETGRRNNKKNTKRRIRCCRFFQNKTSPWNFSEIYFVGPILLKRISDFFYSKGLFLGGAQKVTDCGPFHCPLNMQLGDPNWRKFEWEADKNTARQRYFIYSLEV